MPAQVAGTWRMQKGELRLEQQFQMLSGTYVVDGVETPIEEGRLRGDQISFSVGGVKYSGRVRDGTMVGAGWNATKLQ